MKIPPILIQPTHSIDPLTDRRWVPDGENQWFLPACLDLKNQSYSGYWYATQSAKEGRHYHTGIAYGTVLIGKILLKREDENFEITANQSFFMNPYVYHSGEIVTENNVFLCFGNIVGGTYYESNTLNETTYYEMVKAHYSQHQLSMEEIVNK